MTTSAANILVFDSGVGGLSIVSHLQRQLPSASITYLADNARFPYGLLNDALLIDRVNQLIQTVAAQSPPDIIVIACNSASTLVLPRLRQATTIPIVGVVPAIKPAALQSQTKVIGLLATPGTIQRDYTDELIGDFAKDCRIIRVGSTELVHTVEQMLAGSAPSYDALKAIMAPFQQHPEGHHLDTMVLACTHFPLIKTQLADVAPGIRFWVDSGEAIARRVQSLLALAPPARRASQPSRALFSNAASVNATLATCFAGYGFAAIEQL